MLSLGIDLGTGGVRCIVTEEDGLVVDEHETSLKEINKAKEKENLNRILSIGFRHWRQL